MSINASFNRPKTSSSAAEIAEYLKQHGARQLSTADNSGLLCRFYSHPFRKRMLRDQQHRIAMKNKHAK